MKLVHWSLMGGLLELIRRGGDWAVFLRHVFSATVLPSETLES